MADTYTSTEPITGTWGASSYQRWRWVDPGVQLLFGYCDGDRTIVVVFSDPVKATNVWDSDSALNIANWGVASDKTLPALLAVEALDTDIYRLHFADALPAFPTVITVTASANIATLDGKHILKDYNTVNVVSAVPAKQKLVEAVEKVTPFTDFDLDYDADGTARIGIASHGDYAYAPPISAIRQYILRQIVTLAGEYLPASDFGAGLVPKKVLRPHELAKVATTLKEKLVRLSFVQDAKVRGYTQEGGVVVIAVLVKTKANQQIEVSHTVGGG
jgi:hypothetical protein